VNSAPRPTFFDYSPIIDRPVIRWPNGARVAFWIGVNVEYYEYSPPINAYRSVWPRVPDVRGYGWRDYGNRVGFWRMLEVFDHHRARVTASLNMAILEHFPEMRDAMLDRDWAYLCHGLYNTRLLLGASPQEERALIEECQDIHMRHTGKPLKGMFGPNASISPNTMELIAEAGLTYSTDWYVDDQPFPLNVKSGRLICVPYTWELNDGLLMTAGHGRGLGTFEADYFVQQCRDQFDTLYREGENDGRVMCIALHTSIMGQPHRIDYLDQILDYVLGHDGVWAATSDEIADYYLEHYYDAAIAHPRR
jgi:allantoinase